MTVTQLPITTLDDALAEIARLRHMLSVVQVVRVEIAPPTVVDGRPHLCPVFTCIGIDEAAFTEEVGKHVATYYAAIMAGLVEAVKEAEEAG